jgi:hypothetical protein
MDSVLRRLPSTRRGRSSTHGYLYLCPNLCNTVSVSLLSIPQHFRTIFAFAIRLQSIQHAHAQNLINLLLHVQIDENYSGNSTLMLAPMKEKLHHSVIATGSASTEFGITTDFIQAPILSINSIRENNRRQIYLLPH